MFLFSISSLILFARAYFTNNKSEFLTLAWVANILFYVFLTAMHERYIFYAVPISLITSIYNKKLFILSILMIYIATINLAIYLYGLGNSVLLLRINCILLILSALYLIYDIFKRALGQNIK